MISRGSFSILRVCATRREKNESFGCCYLSKRNNGLRASRPPSEASDRPTEPGQNKGSPGSSDKLLYICLPAFLAVKKDGGGPPERSLNQPRVLFEMSLFHLLSKMLLLCRHPPRMRASSLRRVCPCGGSVSLLSSVTRTAKGSSCEGRPVPSPERMTGVQNRDEIQRNTYFTCTATSNIPVSPSAAWLRCRARREARPAFNHSRLQFSRRQQIFKEMGILLSHRHTD